MPGSKLNLDGDRPFSCHVGLQLDHGGRRIRHLAVAFGDPRQAPHPMGRGRLGQLALVDAQLLRQPHNGQVLVLVDESAGVGDEREQSVGGPSRVLLCWGAW